MQLHAVPRGTESPSAVTRVIVSGAVGDGSADSSGAEVNALADADGVTDGEAELPLAELPDEHPASAAQQTRAMTRLRATRVRSISRC